MSTADLHSNRVEKNTFANLITNRGWDTKGTCENGIRQLSQRVEDECKKCRELREEQERMAALNALRKTGKWW
ncbi:hypothetical protein DER44DRAFT_786719 [Fusarium oxysporum]|nr:hypothetical protein DER44DRAFT_786719 [Fusarium oxysporum]